RQVLLGLDGAPTNLPPHSKCERRSQAGDVTPRHHGRYLGKAGRTSSGAPMSRSARTACSQVPHAWASTGFLRASPPCPGWFLYTAWSQVLPRSASNSHSLPAFYRKAPSILFASRSGG